MAKQLFHHQMSIQKWGGVIQICYPNVPKMNRIAFTLPIQVVKKHRLIQLIGLVEGKSYGKHLSLMVEKPCREAESS